MPKCTCKNCNRRKLHRDLTRNEQTKLLEHADRLSARVLYLLDFIRDEVPKDETERLIKWDTTDWAGFAVEDYEAWATTEIAARPHPFGQPKDAAQPAQNERGGE